MKQNQNRVLIYFALLFLLILVVSVWFINNTYEIRERDRYAILFKERLTIFQYLNEGNYNEANRLLSILLTGDVLAYEKVGDNIDAKQYGLCSRLSPKIKEKLINFHNKDNKGSDVGLKFDKLNSDCIE